ncbi:unnamed protein product, partial [Urochloa humidicola]
FTLHLQVLKVPDTAARRRRRRVRPVRSSSLARSRRHRRCRDEFAGQTGRFIQSVGRSLSLGCNLLVNGSDLDLSDHGSLPSYFRRLGANKARGRFPESSIEMADTTGCKIQRSSGSYLDRSNRNFQIDDFPEDILHKILSHLTFKEIAQTSILSSTWRQTWRSYPELNFCRETLNFNSYIPHYTDDEREFIMRVNSILEYHHCPRLKRFKVSFGLHKGHKDHLDRWIGFAVNSKSKHIVLNLTPHPECLDDAYVFPLHHCQDYSSCFVESIRLVLVVLRPPTGFCGLRNLKRIVLHRVLVWSDLNCVLSACALLEYIRLSDCVLAGFTLCQQLVHLHDFTIENCYVKSMELHATNLISFQFQ